MSSSQRGREKIDNDASQPLNQKPIPLQLLKLKNIPIFEQLQLEEALLRADNRNWCIINHGSSPAIVMGISGKPELLLNQELLAKQPIPVIRRFSGGGTVVIDHNTLFITWICNTSHTNVACCPSQLYQWTTNIYQQFLPTIGMELVENDYVIGGRKFGGNAQYLCKERWLHHSSILWDYNPQQMMYLKIPPKAPKYRQERNHNDFLCKLNPHFASLDFLEQQILEGIHKMFDVSNIELEEINTILKLPHRKGTQLV